MDSPEEKLIRILKDEGVDFTSSLPCEKIKNLITMLPEAFFHLPLTREEEGVGISAGAALAGKKPAMFVQSSGVGNMINALLSLTGFYELPLAIFVSQRGVFQEKIAAQVPMGTKLPGILRGAGIPYSVISGEKDFPLIRKKLSDLFRKNRIHAFLLSPAIFEKSSHLLMRQFRTASTISVMPACPASFFKKAKERFPASGNDNCLPRNKTGQKRPSLTRFDIIAAVHPFLDEKAVISNLGWPSKELFAMGHRPSHFYMLGSMGMVTPIGLGVSLSSEKEVVVIDGDGSILMNPGTLATAAFCSPGNLTILAIDNSAYGSTGNQPTLTGSNVDLTLVAKGFGFSQIMSVSGKKELLSAVKTGQPGPRFIHVRAKPGNADVPPISLAHIENRNGFSEFLRNNTMGSR